MKKVLVSEPEKCVGCLVCELVCATSKRSSLKESRIRVLKMEMLDVNIPVLRVNCDLCSGGERCVACCPTQAIKFMELEEAAVLRKKNRIGAFPSPLIASKGMV